MLRPTSASPVTAVPAPGPQRDTAAAAALARTNSKFTADLQRHIALARTSPVATPATAAAAPTGFKVALGTSQQNVPATALVPTLKRPQSAVLRRTEVETQTVPSAFIPKPPVVATLATAPTATTTITSFATASASGSASVPSSPRHSVSGSASSTPRDSVHLAWSRLSTCSPHLMPADAAPKEAGTMVRLILEAIPAVCRELETERRVSQAADSQLQSLNIERGGLMAQIKELQHALDQSGPGRPRMVVINGQGASVAVSSADVVRIRDLETKLAAAVAAHTSSQADMEHMRRAHAAELETRAAALAQAQRNVEQLNIAQEKLLAENAKLREQHTSAVDQHTLRATTELADCRLKLEDAQRTIQHQQAQIAASDRALKARDLDSSALSQCQRELAAANQQLQLMHSERVTTDRQLAEAASAEGALKRTLATLEGQLRAAEAQVDSLQSQLSHQGIQAATAQTLTATNEAMAEEIHRLQQSLKAASAKAADAELKCRRLEGELASQTADASASKSQMSNLQSQLTDATSQLSSAHGKHDALLKELAACRAERSTAETALRSQLQEVQQKLTKSESACTAAQSQVSSLRDELSKLMQENQQLRQAGSSSQEQVEALTRDVTALRTKLDQTASQLGAVKQQGLQERLRELTEQLASESEAQHKQEMVVSDLQKQLQAAFSRALAAEDATRQAHTELAALRTAARADTGQAARESMIDARLAALRKREQTLQASEEALAAQMDLMEHCAKSFAQREADLRDQASDLASREAAVARCEAAVSKSAGEADQKWEELEAEDKRLADREDKLHRATVYIGSGRQLVQKAASLMKTRLRLQLELLTLTPMLSTNAATCNLSQTEWARVSKRAEELQKELDDGIAELQHINSKLTSFELGDETAALSAVMASAGRAAAAAATSAPAKRV